MCERSPYRRAFATAAPARRPSSSASTTSASLKRRPDSALTSVSAPTISPAAGIGTESPARMPTSSSSSRCCSSWATAASSSSLTSVVSCDRPSRRICGVPLGASAGVG